ncbi:hypothetical protein HGA91_02015 [candidate division WWE3 bacterium]|nr:hypothetical protein [candidate division WWE3 bacterium]
MSSNKITLALFSFSLVSLISFLSFNQVFIFLSKTPRFSQLASSDIAVRASNETSQVLQDGDLTVASINRPQYDEKIHFSGNKKHGEKVLLNGQVIVPIGTQTSWQYEYPLQRGQTVVAIQSVNSANAITGSIYQHIQRLGMGDISQNGSVDIFDLGILIGNYGKVIDQSASNSTNILLSDFNLDQKVDIFDLGLLAGKYGQEYSYQDDLSAIPNDDRATYEHLRSKLKGMEEHYQVPANTNATRVGVELINANGHNGTKLLESGYYDKVLQTLTSLQQLGIKGVTVQIPYPILIESFPRANEYLTFYKQLASEIRSRSLNLNIESQSLVTTPGFTDISFNYGTLTRQQFLDGRYRQLQTIANELKPDLLSIVDEPTTEVGITGFTILPIEYINMVKSIKNNLPEGQVIQLGAGAGIWENQLYFDRFSNEPSIDFVTMHVYPLEIDDMNLIDRMDNLMSSIRQAGKKVVIGEAWLYKATSSEMPPELFTTNIFKKDVLDHWSILDRQFLKVLLNISYKNDASFVSLFWSNYLFSQLTYTDELHDLTYAQLSSLNNLRAGDRIANSQFSSIGNYLKQLLKQSMSSATIKLVTDKGGRLSWSDTKQTLAYDRIGIGFKYDIYTSDLNGQAVRCLTCTIPTITGGNVGQPAWHPAGVWLAAQVEDTTLTSPLGEISTTPGTGINNNLWFINSETLATTKLTSIRAGDAILHPQFSNSGDVLIWSQTVDPFIRADTQWSIKLASIQFNNQTPYISTIQDLRPGNLYFYETHGFSPDGQSIIFSGFKEGQSYMDLEVYTYNLSTGVINQLTSNQAWDEHAHISPDGNKVVWISTHDTDQSQGRKFELWIMDIDGGNKRKLTHFHDSLFEEYDPNATGPADCEWITPTSVISYFIRSISPLREDILLFEDVR